VTLEAAYIGTLKATIGKLTNENVKLNANMDALEPSSRR